MRNFIQQIKSSINANLYYLSLYATLTLPDICGALESNNGIATKQKYINWFDHNLGSKYDHFLTGTDCYFLRCSLLHQGSSQHPSSTYSRVIFVEPNATTNIFHCNIINDALNIDVRIFCNDVLDAAEAWLGLNENSNPYKTNYDMFMRRYPNGLPPYIGGVPVIS